jgi:hypothetical protein
MSEKLVGTKTVTQPYLSDGANIKIKIGIYIKDEDLRPGIFKKYTIYVDET